MFPQPGGSFENHVKDEPWEQRKWGASRVSSMLRVSIIVLQQQSISKKETKLGASVVIILTQREGSCFLSLLDKLDSIVESEFFDKMRTSSLRFILNREESTWLNHSRFIASLTRLLWKHYVGILYIKALEKYMSFTNGAHANWVFESFQKSQSCIHQFWI